MATLKDWAVGRLDALSLDGKAALYRAALRLTEPGFSLSTVWTASTWESMVCR
jgi:hypothetical protein